MNEVCLDDFFLCKYYVEFKGVLDYCLMIIIMVEVVWFGKRIFKYFNMWVNNENYMYIVEKY